MGDIHPGRYWSHTLGTDIAACHRRAYYRVFGGWGGWRKDGPADTVTLYTAKCSSTIEQFTGILVHESIKTCLQNLGEGRSWPKQAWGGRTERKFDEALQYSRKRQWRELRSPKGATLILQEHLSGADEPSNRIEASRKRALDCMNAFFDDVLPWLSSFGTGAWNAIDNLSSFNQNGFDIFVAPDLLVHDADSTWLVIDWKTGATPDVNQLEIYGLYVEEKKENDAAKDGRIKGASIPLLHSKATERVDIGVEAIQRARTRIDTDLAWLSTVGPPGVDRDRRSFPKTEHKERCNGCPYQFHCDMES